MGRLSKIEKRKMCAGCHDNYYNCNETDCCWSLRTAKVVKRKMVHINDVPPWNHTPIKTLSCFHRPKFVMVGERQTC